MDINEYAIIVMKSFIRNAKNQKKLEFNVTQNLPKTKIKNVTQNHPKTKTKKSKK